MKRFFRVSAIVVGWTMLFCVDTQAQTESRDMIACQKQFIRQVQSHTRLAARKLQSCTDKVLKCNLASEIDTVDPTACLDKATTACAKVEPALAKAITKRRENMIKKCGAIPIAELEQFLAGLGFLDPSANCGSLAPPLSPIPVTDATDLIDCTLATTQCAVEREVYLRDPRALDSLTDVGVAASFPCVGS